MDFDEQVDLEEEMRDIPPVEPPPQDGYAESLDRPEGMNGGASSTRKPCGAVRYRECLKNHALGIGGTAVDGCGEFMAAGEEGTLDALRCAACNCHRNFHRKETDSSSGGAGVVYHHPHHLHRHHQFSPYCRSASAPAGYLQLTPPPPQPQPQQNRLLALPSTVRDDLEYVSNPGSSFGGSGRAGLLKKRFRTKFTQDQKDKMLGFAERLGWRIQKHDDAAVEQFCSETGINRQVLKVWMHNNKQALGKKTLI